MKFIQLTLKRWTLTTLAILFVGMTMAHAGPKAAEFKKQVGLVVYSLENAKAGFVGKDLDQLDAAAGQAMTIELAAQIAERFQTGLELLEAIVVDPSMTKDEKREVLPDLIGSLGQIYMTVVRQHGEDELHPEELKAPVFATFLGRAMKEFKHMFIDVFLPQDAEKVRTFDEQLAILNTGVTPALEMQKQWRVTQLMIRDLLLQEMTIAYQRIILSIGDLKTEVADDVFLENIVNPPENRNDDWADRGNAEKALALRTYRRTSHYAALSFVGGLAAYWMLGTPIDFVGMATEYTDHATVVLTDSIVFGSLASLALLKQATSANGSVPAIKRLVEIASQPGVPKEFSSLKLPLLARLKGLEKKFNKARSEVTPPDAEEKLNQCLAAMKKK